MRGKVDAGDRAPEFRARDVLGREFDMAGFLGRGNLVFFFYRNAQCQTCREELKDLADKYPYISQQDAEVVAISTDGIDIAKNLAVDLRLPFRVISDLDGDIIREYGVWDDATDTASPTIFVIDKEGVVRYKKAVESLFALVPADEIVNMLRELGTPRIGGDPFRSFRYK